MPTFKIYGAKLLFNRIEFYILSSVLQGRFIVIIKGYLSSAGPRWVVLFNFLDHFYISSVHLFFFFHSRRLMRFSFLDASKLYHFIFHPPTIAPLFRTE